MSLGLDPIRDVRDVGIDQYRAGLGEYLGAVASDAWANSPMNAVGRLLDTAEAGARAERTGERLLTAEEATDRGRDIGLRFEAPIAESAYSILATAKQAQIASESVFKRARLEDGYGTMRWLLAGGTEFLTMAADPLNIASAFVPVVSQARYAAMASRMGPLGATLARGAIEGAAGQALLEPITALDQSMLGNEYSLLNTLVNLSFGAGLGVVLHGAAYGAGGGFRFIRNRYAVRELAPELRATPEARTATPEIVPVEEAPPRQPVAEAMEKLRPETRDAALRSAVAQLAQDKPVDIDPVLRADPAWQQVRAEMDAAPQRPDLEELQRLSAESTKGVLPAIEPPPEWRPSPEELKLATRAARGWTPEVALATPQSLVDFVRKNGGLIRDTPEAAELQASDLGRQPGLLRTREKGRQADQMAQAAADAGYRLGKETATGSGIDVDAFIRALIEDAQGTRKHFPDNAHTTAWQVQQEYFASFSRYLQDVLGVDPKGMEPRQLAWLLAQDQDTARLMVLLRDVDALGPEGSLELAARLDAERAALEAQILSDEPGRIEPDGPIADHRDTPAATLAELERYYADHERTAGETRQGGQAAGGQPAGGRSPEGGQAAPARPARGDDPAAGAGLRREEGEGRPAAAEPRAQDLADFAQRQRAADLQADPAALALRDERLAGEAREIQQLLADDLADFGHVLDENTRALFDEAGKIFDDEAKAIDALASCRIGGDG